MEELPRKRRDQPLPLRERKGIPRIMTIQERAIRSFFHMESESSLWFARSFGFAFEGESEGRRR